MNPSWGWLAVLLYFPGAAGAWEPPSPDPAPASAERLQKLIANLGDSRFKVREQATEELTRQGRLALLVLKMAAVESKDPEVRKRAQALVDAIQTQDRPRDALLTLLARLQQIKPALSDRQLIVAIYLLSVSRPATDAELNAAEKRLRGADDKAREVEVLMESLLTARTFNAKLADCHLQVTALKQKVGGMDLAVRLAKLNSDEFQKSLVALSDQLNAAMDGRSDEQVVDALFLVVLARFPRAEETTAALGHIKKADNRKKALPDLFWALTNTREFLFGN